MAKIILTGDRPTGKLHIGHYAGSIRKRLELQNTDFDKMYVMIADSQALTDNFSNPSKVLIIYLVVLILKKLQFLFNQ